MVCSNCGQELEMGAKFCPWCGQKTESCCPNCGEVIEETAKFCPYCGEGVAERVKQMETDAVDLVLQEVGENKVKIISIVREATGWGLKESKDAVDRVEWGIEFVIHNIPQEKAQRILNEFRNNGATAIFVECGIEQVSGRDEKSAVQINNSSNAETGRTDLSNVLLAEKQESNAEKGVKGKIQQAKQSVKDILEEDDHITEMTDDEYRNKLASQAKLLNIGETIAALICIKIIWNYHQIFTLKDGILAFMAIGLIFGLVEEIIGCDRYFGVRRIKRYDKVKESSSQKEAVLTMENNKGGTIRAILTFLLFTVGMLLIADFCCTQYAEMIVRKQISEALEDLSFSVDGQEEFSGDSFTNKIQIGEKLIDIDNWEAYV